MRKWLLTVAAASLVATAAFPFPSIAAEYLLGPQDKLRLKIYEWRASKDVIFEWTALNDDFVIAPNGTLFLPFIGEIRAEGTAPSDLARAIGDRLMQHMGLGRQPDVAVEIVQFRPFYIVGDVTQSGEFPYRPGLTVLQALGIAGGLRAGEENLARLEREAITGRGDVGLLALTNVSLMAKKARLEAELATSDDIAFPPELKNRTADGTVGLVLEQERRIFTARKDALTTQLRALSELRVFLEQELVSQEKQLTFHDKQLELVNKELAGVASLVQKGLAVSPRQLELERTVAQMQSDRLAAETALLRARQEMSRTDISMLELRNRYANEAADSLRETQMQIDEIARKADTAVQLLHEIEITAPLAIRQRSERVKPVYKIVRTKAGETSEFTAEETTPIEPGDTVKVEIPLSQSADLTTLPASTVQAGTMPVRGSSDTN